MGDILRERIGGYLNDRLREVNASPVTYKRGADEFEIRARANPPEQQEIDDEVGFVRDVNQQVFIVNTEDMVINGTPIRPAVGDQVIMDGIHFDVLPDGSNTNFRWSDPWRGAMRIYTKESKQATA